jgi:hypothetical protein
MNATIGVYDSHKKALRAVEELQQAGYPVTQLSLIGKADLIDDHLHIRSNELIKEAPVSIGIILGPLLGVLTGVGILAIPGLGFLFGAGALVGAFAGFDIGLVGGGLISLLTTIGFQKDIAIKYHEHLKVNRFLVVAQGDEKEVKKAKEILHEHGTQMELNCH